MVELKQGMLSPFLRRRHFFDQNLHKVTECLANVMLEREEPPDVVCNQQHDPVVDGFEPIGVSVLERFVGYNLIHDVDISFVRVIIDDDRAGSLRVAQPLPGVAIGDEVAGLRAVVGVVHEAGG